MSKLLLFGRKNSKIAKEKQRQFLDSHPAKQLALPRNVDRSKFGHASSVTETAGPAGMSRANEAILLNYGCSMSSKVAAWTASREQDAEEFLAMQVKRGKTLSREQQARSLHSFMEQIYFNLRRHQYHINRVTVGSDLYITDSLLAEVNEPIQVNRFGEVQTSATFLRTRFSTLHYSLVARGRDDLIEFFLIPCTQIMSFSKIEDQFMPLAVVQIKADRNGNFWRVKENGPLVSALEDLTMWLVDQLILKTKQSIMGESGSHESVQTERNSRADFAQNVFDAKPKVFEDSVDGSFADSSETSTISVTTKHAKKLSQIDTLQLARVLKHESDMLEPLFDIKQAWG